MIVFPLPSLVGGAGFYNLNIFMVSHYNYLDFNFIMYFLTRSCEYILECGLKIGSLGDKLPYPWVDTQESRINVYTIKK